MKEKPTILMEAEAIINQDKNAEKKANKVLQTAKRKVEIQTLKEVAKRQKSDIGGRDEYFSPETIEKLKNGDYDLTPGEIAHMAISETREIEKKFDNIFNKLNTTEKVSEIKKIGTEIAMLVKENPEHNELMISRTAKALVNSAKMSGALSDKTTAIKDIFDGLTGGEKTEYK